MGLFQKLKSALGLDGAESPGTGQTGPGDVDVTVEREPSSASEDAVKGTETAGTAAPVSESATGTESAAEPEETTEAESATETEPRSEDQPRSEAEQRTDDGSPTAVAASGNADESAGDAVPETPVTEINGIGPAYGSRLEDAGVGSVAELTDADAGELAAATDISETRIEGWIDAAREY